MYRAVALVLILSALLCAGRAIADESSRVRPKKSTTGAVFRSLAVPGWGQAYNESYVKAAAFFVTEALFIVGISRYNDWMMAAKKADNFEEEKLYRSSRNKNIWWLAGIKLLSLGDAYVDAQLFQIDVSPNLTPEGVEGAQIGATIRF
ncbi:hypothetical protein HUU59_04605 [bacterium]|nr:hypothetical protein [bacterium]